MVRITVYLCAFALLVSVILLLLWIYNLVTTQQQGSIAFTGGGNFSLGWVFAPPVLFMAWRSFAISQMQASKRDFAHKNGFEIIAAQSLPAVVTVPSFRGKTHAIASEVIREVWQGKTKYLFTRVYREGGVLRWREWRMDTVLAIQLDAQLPHIIINATSNERARHSNMSVKPPYQWALQFEGIHGEHYTVYTDPLNRIEALKLFTPDVLEVLYQKLSSADIELKDNMVWIVQRYGVLDDVQAKAIHEGAESVLALLTKQMRTMQRT